MPPVRHRQRVKHFHEAGCSLMGYLEEDERRKFKASLEGAGDRASTAAPLTWLRMESAGARAEVRLTLWPDGEDRVIGRASYHGDLVDLRCAV